MRSVLLAVTTALVSYSSFSQSFVLGKVLNAQQQPLKGVEVSIVGSKEQVFSDQQGQFTLPATTKFPIEIHVQSSGYNHKNIFVNNAEQFITVTLDKSIIEHIDVIGLPIHASTLESAVPVNVVSGEMLRDKQASTLGETLKAELGIHSTYFGPVSSSPIIRGLDGPRVLITQNSLDVSDASRIGPDHIVASETSTAHQIEVLRGPATLFYGSGAIGGVVNVVDHRVPNSTETRGDFQLSHNTVADENEAAFNLNTGKDNIAYHFDAFYRDSNDYDIPEAAELDDDEHDSSDAKLANSAAKANGFTAGTSYLFDQGFVGISYGYLDREYGIPGHVHHDEHEEEGEDEHHEDEIEPSVRGELTQDRWQMLSEINIKNSWLTSVNTKLGYTDYSHEEIENNEVATRFSNESIQTKIDLGLADISGWRGALTFDIKHVDFEALGEEAFTPSNESESIAIAFVEEKHFGDVLVQLGARIEKVTLNANSFELPFSEHDEHEEHGHEEEHDEHEGEHHDEDEHSEIHFRELDYTPVSFSIGALWDFSEGYNLGVSIAHAERAPSAGEIFSFGPHIGTSSYEVGAYFELHEEDDHDEEPHFDVSDHKPEIETSNNIDISLRKFEGDFGFILSSFYNRINDFYYQENTGHFFDEAHDHGMEEDEHEEEGLPIYIYQQADAEFYGAEAQFIWQLNSNYKTTLLADTIRGKLTSGENLPRIPPSRLGLITNAEFDQWRSELSIMHHFEQNDLAELETATDSYTMIDLTAHYYFSVSEQDMSVYFKANNITDEAARVHTSFIKNQTLLPGRAFTLGIRGDF